MVIGRGKEQLIQKEPLLAWYFKIFKEVLFQTNRHLLLIGYGFGDDHINDIIANAIKQYGLKIYIISGSVKFEAVAQPVFSSYHLSFMLHMINMI